MRPIRPSQIILACMAASSACGPRNRRREPPRSSASSIDRSPSATGAARGRAATLEISARLESFLKAFRLQGSRPRREAFPSLAVLWLQIQSSNRSGEAARGGGSWTVAVGSPVAFPPRDPPRWPPASHAPASTGESKGSGRRTPRRPRRAMHLSPRHAPIRSAAARLGGGATPLIWRFPVTFPDLAPAVDSEKEHTCDGTVAGPRRSTDRLVWGLGLVVRVSREIVSSASPAAKARAASSGFGREGVVTAPSYAYTRRSLGNVIAIEGRGRKALAFFGWFR